MWDGFIWISLWINNSREPADSIKMLYVYKRLRRRIVFSGINYCVGNFFYCCTVHVVIIAVLFQLTHIYIL